MATHSSILVWRIPWTEETDGLQSMGLKESNKTKQLTLWVFQVALVVKNLPGNARDNPMV